MVFLLAITFGSGNDFAWDSAAVIVCFILGTLVLIGWCVYNFGFSKNPLLPWEVVRIIQVSAASLTLFCAFGSFMSGIIYVSIYFQVIHGANAWHSGVDLLPFIIAVVISSIMLGIIIAKSRFVKPFTVIAGALGPLGYGLVSLLEVDSSSSSKIGLLIVPGVSTGMQMQASMIALQVAAPKTPGGMIYATTYINVARATGGALASALSTAVYSSAQDIQRQLSLVPIDTLVNSTELIKTLSPEAQKFVKDQVMWAIKRVFYMALGFAGLGFISSLFATNHRLPKQSVGAAAASSEPKEELKEESKEERLETDNDSSVTPVDGANEEKISRSSVEVKN